MKAVKSKIIYRTCTNVCMLIVLFIFSSCNTTASEQKNNSRPNIVLIVADDLGYGDLGCYGATKIQTPAIDSLANQGLRFSQAYASSSMCSPSRYSILTGRYSWRTRLKYGVLKYFDKPLIENDRTTLASLLKRNGYYTACVGKWHLGMDWSLNENAPDNPDKTVFNSWNTNTYEFIDYSESIKNGPCDRGFDYFYGMAGSNNMQPYVIIENDRVTEPPTEIQSKPYDHYHNVLSASNWDIKTLNIDFTNKAVDVIDNHFQDNRKEPLFLYFPASAPHRPCLPTFTKGKSQAGLRGDVIEELDWSVEQIVNALKRNGVFDNTLVVFTSDNGPRAGDPVTWLDIYEAEEGYEDCIPDSYELYEPELVNENGNKIWKKGWITYDHSASGDLLGYKSDAWEGGFRVPLIMYWPDRIIGGSDISNMVCLSDLFATFADITGDTLKSSEGEDSYSFLPNLIGRESDQVRNSMVLSGGASGAFVCIKDGWKYIEAAVPGRWPETFYPDGPKNTDYQLYNLTEDVSEQNNLYNEYPDKILEFKELIIKAKTNTKFETTDG